MITRAEAEALDLADPLRAKRQLFVLPENTIYLDGNSLGPLPHHVADRISGAVAHEWGQSLIRGWNTHGWFDLPRVLGDRIGKLIGAGPGTVLAADSTSINLVKVLTAALGLRPAGVSSFPTAAISQAIFMSRKASSRRWVVASSCVSWRRKMSRRRSVMISRC